jgi:competence protein ComEC
VFFSSGYLNRMHHPHPETLERYQKAGVDIRRTDLHGAVQVITNGDSYKIHTHEKL